MKLLDVNENRISPAELQRVFGEAIPMKYMMLLMPPEDNDPKHSVWMVRTLINEMLTADYPTMEQLLSTIETIRHIASGERYNEEVSEYIVRSYGEDLIGDVTVESIVRAMHVKEDVGGDQEEIDALCRDILARVGRAVY